MIRSLPCPLCRHQPRFSTIFRHFRTLASAGGFCIRCLRYCCLCFARPCRVWEISWKSGCGAQRLDFLRRFLPYERGLPAHDTPNDVINGLDAELFKTCFTNWAETLRDRAPDIIAIDGKTSRRTHARRKGRAPLHLVSAWAARQRLVLGQEAVDEKSKEIVAIPLLLKRLELTGALVTIDAMGTQADIAEKISRARGGDYLLALKANREILHGTLRRSSTIRQPIWWNPTTPRPMAITAASRSVAISSATRSTRNTWIAAMPMSRAFPSATIGMDETRVERNGALAQEQRYFPRQRSTPKPSRRQSAPPLGRRNLAALSRRRLPRRSCPPPQPLYRNGKTWPVSNTWPRTLCEIQKS